MPFVAETAKIDEPETLADMGPLDGAASPPAPILKSGGNTSEVIASLDQFPRDRAKTGQSLV